MSGQLESNHFFRSGDSVRRSDGEIGVIVEEWSLYAVVMWSDGSREEVDQFDPGLIVVERASTEP